MENPVKGLRDQLDRNDSEDRQSHISGSCNGLDSSRPKSCPPPSLQNLGLLPYVVTDVTQWGLLRWGHLGFAGWALKANVASFWEGVRGRLATEEKAATEQRLCCSLQKPEEAVNRVSLPQSLPRVCGSSNTLLSNLWPPGLWETKLLLF